MKKDTKKVLWIIGIIVALILLLILIIFINNLTGFVVNDVEKISSDNAEMSIIEESNSKVISLDVPDGKIELYFELLDYNKLSNAMTSSNQTLDEINIEEIEEISNDFILSPEDFDIEAKSNNGNDSQPDFKWGYRFKLNDLKFLAKIIIKSDLPVSKYNENSIKVGNAILSFEDLVNTGYSVSIDKPSLSIDNYIELNESFVNESMVNNTIEINVSEDLIVINNTLSNDSNDSNDSNYSSELISNDSNEIIEINLDNETNGEDNDGGNESVVEDVVTEPVVDNVEDVVEEVNTEENNINLNNELVSNVVIENNADSQTGSESAPVDNSASPSSEGSTGSESSEISENSGALTGNIIKSFFKWTGKVIGLNEKNTISIYIEKDFSKTDYKIGDLVDLDPSYSD